MIVIIKIRSEITLTAFHNYNNVYIKWKPTALMLRCFKWGYGCLGTDGFLELENINVHIKTVETDIVRYYEQKKWRDK
jgi:hypothetical protein